MAGKNDIIQPTCKNRLGLGEFWKIEFPLGNSCFL